MDVIKMEAEDDPFGLLPPDDEYKMEQNKALSEEGNLSHLEAMTMKTECVDHSCDIKTEIKVEDTSDPLSFPVVKTEIDELIFDLDRVQQEQEAEVSSEEDEVLTERISSFD
ncbi:uncharacterized protein [Periplaneta americana]|uniref:uncharacterized protein isoform X4 n=1 Tax=Periplaneta americana TaxID=6978 RepID=UPI0037E9039C